MKLFLLAALLSAPAFADGDAPDFQVETNPKAYAPSEFAADHVRTGAIPPREKRPDALPDKKDRDAVFARVPGLAGDIAGMDELDRDLLYVRAKNKNLADLEKIYPKISRRRLARLRKECGW